MGSSVILPSPGQPKQGPDPSFKSASLPNVVTFGFLGVEPPSPLYVTRDDVLNIFAASDASLGNTQITMVARILQPLSPQAGQPDQSGANPLAIPPGPGSIVTIVETLFTPAGGGTILKQRNLGEGYLLSLGFIGGGGQARGQQYVRAYIARTAVSGGFVNITNDLVADYITQNHPVGWPYGRQIFPTEGPGWLTAITVGNPAAGADWSFTVPLRTRWRISSWNAQLAVANAGVARIIRAQIKQTGALLVWQAAAQQTAAINTTVQVSASPTQVQTVVDTTTLNLPLPSPCFLSAGDSFGVSTSNINAGDQWTNIFVEIEQTLDLV